MAWESATICGAGRIIGLALLAALSGCLTPLENQPWVRVETDNFVLYSQISEREAVEIAEKLEVFRDVTRKRTSASQAAFEPVIPTLTYVFASTSAYREFGPRRSAGCIYPTQRANYIALDARSPGLDPTRIVYHEFAHYLLRAGGASAYPLWFDEGLAEYLGATVIEEGRVVFASAPRDRLPELFLGERLPLERLMTAADTSDWSDRDNSMLYAQSWALVHYLYSGGGDDFPDRRAHLSEYIQLLNQGVPTEEAFRVAFDTTFAGLGGELDRYLENGKLKQIEYPRDAFAAGSVRSTRAVPPQEIAAHLGRLSLVAGEPRRALDFFDSALQGDPDHARAIAGVAQARAALGQGGVSDQRALLERAVEIDPDDAENHLDLGVFLLAVAQANTEHPEFRELLQDSRDAFATAISLDPELPEAYARAAVLYTLPGQDWRKGLPLIEYAYQLLPTDISIALTLAGFSVLDGKYDRAEDLVEISAQWAVEAGGAQDQAIQAVRDQLAAARSSAPDVAGDRAPAIRE